MIEDDDYSNEIMAHVLKRIRALPEIPTLPPPPPLPRIAYNDFTLAQIPIKIYIRKLWDLI